MQKKITDFRKCLDTYRAVRDSKLKELVTPFVNFAMENELDIDVKSYLYWTKSHVKCQVYQSVFQIEKNFRTSLLLYHARRVQTISNLQILQRRSSVLYSM